MPRVRSTYKSSYGCKEINLLEKRFKELIIDYIHFLADKKKLDLNQLYSLFFVPTKKSKKINHVNLRDSLVSRLNFDFPSLNVKINENNLYEQIDTGFIISQEKDRMVVIGKVDKENPNQLSFLTKEDIQVCKEHNFMYEIPANLFEQIVVRENDSGKTKMEKIYHKLKFGQDQEEGVDVDEDEEDPEE